MRSSGWRDQHLDSGWGLPQWVQKWPGGARCGFACQHFSSGWGLPHVGHAVLVGFAGCWELLLVDVLDFVGRAVLPTVREHRVHLRWLQGALQVGLWSSVQRWEHWQHCQPMMGMLRRFERGYESAASVVFTLSVWIVIDLLGAETTRKSVWTLLMLCRRRNMT